MSVMTVPTELRKALGETGTDQLISIINFSEKHVEEEVIKLSEDKFGRRLVEETTKLDKTFHKVTTEETTKLEKRITELDKRITEETAKLGNSITEKIAKLDNRITEVKSELIKWMFIFGIAQTGVIAGLIISLLN